MKKTQQLCRIGNEFLVEKKENIAQKQHWTGDKKWTDGTYVKSGIHKDSIENEGDREEAEKI